MAPFPDGVKIGACPPAVVRLHDPTSQVTSTSVLSATIELTANLRTRRAELKANLCSMFSYT